MQKLKRLSILTDKNIFPAIDPEILNFYRENVNELLTFMFYVFCKASSWDEATELIFSSFTEDIFEGNATPEDIVRYQSRLDCYASRIFEIYTEFSYMANKRFHHLRNPPEYQDITGVYIHDINDDTKSIDIDVSIGDQIEDTPLSESLKPLIYDRINLF